MAKKDRIIREELRQWLDESLISQELHDSLAARYREGSWDISVIIRWTLVLGAIMLGIGLITFFLTIMDSKALIAIVLTLLCGLSYYFGLSMTLRTGGRYYPKSGNALIAVACLLLCGDIFVIGDILSTGSGHWPILLLIATAIYFGVAYWHKNTLVLVFALLGLATWFGTESGYVSGWGAYYLGLNYPMRFALVSPLVVLFGYLHEKLRLFNAPEAFVKAYYSIGLLYVNLSLWIMSIFGNYGDMHIWREASQWELLVFALIWGLADVVIFVIGSRWQNRMFTGYAIVFLILNIYTRYFEFFWDEMHKSLFFIVLGGMSIAVGLIFERRLKAAQRTQVQEKA